MSSFPSKLLSFLPSVRGLEGIRTEKGSSEKNPIKYLKAHTNTTKPDHRVAQSCQSHQNKLGTPANRRDQINQVIQQYHRE